MVHHHSHWSLFVLLLLLLEKKYTANRPSKKKCQLFIIQKDNPLKRLAKGNIFFTFSSLSNLLISNKSSIARLLSSRLDESNPAIYIILLQEGNLYGKISGPVSQLAV